MKKLIIALAVAVIGSLGTTIPAQAAPVQNIKDCDGVYSGTYRNVTVQAGSSCTLTPEATVLGGVHAKPGAENLFVHTGVGRNVHAVGVTGTVHVGPESCKYDPPVGNNVMVKDSHNVLICWVTAENNIRVTGNDGRITVRDSAAGNNVHVTRNLPFVRDGEPTHNRAGAIRVLRTTYDNHLVTSRNSGRRVVLRGTEQPAPVEARTSGVTATPYAFQAGPGCLGLHTGQGIDAYHVDGMVIEVPDTNRVRTVKVNRRGGLQADDIYAIALPGYYVSPNQTGSPEHPIVLQIAPGVGC